MVDSFRRSKFIPFTLESLALKKSGNVQIFEAIKKELDARVMENSGMVSSDNRTQPLCRKISSVSFCKVVFCVPFLYLTALRSQGGFPLSRKNLRAFYVRKKHARKQFPLLRKIILLRCLFLRTFTCVFALQTLWALG